MSDDGSVSRHREEARMKELLKVAMGTDDISPTLDKRESKIKRDSTDLNQAKTFLEDLDDDEGNANNVPTGEQKSEYSPGIITPHQHTDSGLRKVTIGGPEPKPPKPPSRRRVLHNQLAESLSSTRDKESKVDQSVNLMDPSYQFPFIRKTGLSESIFGSNKAYKHNDVAGNGESGEFIPIGKRTRMRLFRYDLVDVMAMFLVFSIVGAAGLLFFLANPEDGPGLPKAASFILPWSSGSSDSGRYDAIMAKLNSSTYVNAHALETGGTAQNQAMNWICNEDPAQLDVEDDFLLSRYALAVLFYSTSGRAPSDSNFNATDWRNTTNWLTAEGYCSWYGITCIGEDDYFESDGNGKVFQVELPDNMLRGALPAEVAALSDLFILNLNTNYIAGSIPPEYGRLTNVRDLFLANNKLKGTIPAELGSMKELRKLTLADNDFNGTIPESIGHASHMHYIAMENNFLSGALPKSLSSLSKLETFHASSNKLSGTIPEEFYAMTSLVTLRLSDNGLTGTISPNLYQLSHLETLHLVGNELSGTIPDSFESMALLGQLHLGYNKFSGTIPQSLGNRNRMERLSVEGNDLTGFMPDSVCDLTEAGRLVHVAADCYHAAIGMRTVIDLANIESSQTGMAGEMGQLIEEKEDLIEEEGIACDCCTDCF